MELLLCVVCEMSFGGMSGRSGGSGDHRTPTIEAKVVILGTQGECVLKCAFVNVCVCAKETEIEAERECVCVCVFVCFANLPIAVHATIYITTWKFSYPKITKHTNM